MARLEMVPERRFVHSGIPNPSSSGHRGFHAKLPYPADRDLRHPRRGGRLYRKASLFPGLSGKACSTARFQPIKNLARGKDWMVPLQDVPRFEHA